MDKDLYKAKRAREELSATRRGNRAVTGSAGWLRRERHLPPCLDGPSLSPGSHEVGGGAAPGSFPPNSIRTYGKWAHT